MSRTSATPSARSVITRALTVAAAVLLPLGVALADDAYPTPPAPDVPDPFGAEALAGVGSAVPYSEAGTGEGGADLSLNISGDSVVLSADPMIGWSLWDDIQLSGIVGVQWHRRRAVASSACSGIVGVQWASVGGESTSRLGVMMEPSVHLPTSDRFFVSAGLGGGVAAIHDPATSDTPGFAIAPRVGVQCLVGRPGLLYLSFRPPFTVVDAESDLAPGTNTAALDLSDTYSTQFGDTVQS